MKALMIIFNQAYYEAVVSILEKNSVRGYTYWPEVEGRGSDKGEPHFGSHAWPTLNGAIISVVDDSRTDALLQAFRKLDETKPELGLRAFAWDVTAGI
jgi:nitrogen regulatory protein PII